MENGQEYLSKDEILGMQDIQIERVLVPEWNNRPVFVSGLSAAAKNAYQASIVDMTGKGHKARLENMTAKLLILTLVNANGQRLFVDTDVTKLGAKSAAALERLYKVASRLSGMDPEENEQLLKNSEAAQSGDSPTASL